MTFTILPAVDVAAGQVVRIGPRDLGGAPQPTDPLEVALAFQRDGAEWIHLVDLDAAFGRGSNAQLLSEVIAKLGVPVELSAGIANDAGLQRALESGCARIVLSTNALERRSWCKRVIAEHGDRIAIALDVQVAQEPNSSPRHRLAARGANLDVGDMWEAIAWLDALGCRRYIITDVSKDGMLAGPNIDLYRDVLAVTQTNVIASGGVSSIADLIALANLAQSCSNVEGAVVGSAFHVNAFTFADAIAAARHNE